MSLLNTMIHNIKGNMVRIRRTIQQEEAKLVSLQADLVVYNTTGLLVDTYACAIEQLAQPLAQQRKLMSVR